MKIGTIPTERRVAACEELCALIKALTHTAASLSRKVMEADPMNIAHCPYSVFVMERDGKVEVGYPTYPEGPMQEVQAMLDEIVQDALE